MPTTTTTLQTEAPNIIHVALPDHDGSLAVARATVIEAEAAFAIARHDAALHAWSYEPASTRLALLWAQSTIDRYDGMRAVVGLPISSPQEDEDERHEADPSASCGVDARARALMRARMHEYRNSDDERLRRFWQLHKALRELPTSEEMLRRTATIQDELLKACTPAARATFVERRIDLLRALIGSELETGLYFTCMVRTHCAALLAQQVEAHDAVADSCHEVLRGEQEVADRAEAGALAVLRRLGRLPAELDAG